MTDQPVPLPIGHTTFAAILGGIADAQDGDNARVPERTPDTLPQWLRHRFGSELNVKWADLDDGERAYWAHQAAAVRRAVERNGFKDPTTPA